jgi:paraquat-inducible protein A
MAEFTQHDGYESGLIACHDCDSLHRLRPVPEGGEALCTRCGALLYRHIPDSLNRALALNLAAFMLFVMANAFPFLSLKLGGRIEENVLLSGALALYREGMGELGVVVFLTSLLFPLLTISGMLFVLVPLKFGYRPHGIAKAYRLVRALTPWSLIGVFMLGVLIAVVKLLDLATVIPGVSLYAFAALLVVSAAAAANLDTSVIWPHPGQKIQPKASGATAADENLMACHTCGMLVARGKPAGDRHGRCPRCDSALHGGRKANSIARTWALIVAASILLIPANVYPVLTVIRFGQGAPDTILSGVVHLIEGGMWPLALIVFFASIVVPITKLIVLSFLLISIHRRIRWRPRDRTRLYRVTEVVGAWSMVDIFLVAILTGLVNLDALSTIRPGIGATFFAGVVVITMFAASSFDPRLIWDSARKEK